MELKPEILSERECCGTRDKILKVGELFIYTYEEDYGDGWQNCGTTYYDNFDEAWLEFINAIQGFDKDWYEYRTKFY